MTYQSKVKAKLIKEGWTVLKNIRLSESGFPDLHAMKLGEIDKWIEVKKDGDTIKPLQKLRIDQLISLGKDAYCLHETKGVIYPL